MKNHFILKLFALVLLLALGTYCFFHFNWHVYFIDKHKAINFIESFHPYDEVVFVSLQILQVVFAPVPGEVTGLIGGYLYGIVLGAVYSTIGLTIGSWLAFMMARIFGLPFVERTLSPKVLKKYDYLMEHQGAFVSFVFFLIPGFPKDFLCYIMGLSHMKTATFLVVSTVGRLFGTILLSVCGSYARNNHYSALAITFGISGSLLLLAYVYRESWIETLRKKKQES